MLVDVTTELQDTKVSRSCLFLPTPGTLQIIRDSTALLFLEKYPYARDGLKNLQLSDSRIHQSPGVQEPTHREAAQLFQFRPIYARFGRHLWPNELVDVSGSS